MPKQKSKKRNKGLWGSVIFFSLLGLASSIYLTHLHAKIYTDPDYKSICAISQTFNCESVALSKYSLFLNVPVSVWGILGYLLFLGLALIAIRSSEKEEGVHGLMFLGSGFALLSSITLAYISHAKIGALCPACMVTYGVNLLIFLLVVILHKKDKVGVISSIGSGFGLLSKNGKYLFMTAFVVVILMLAYPRYWQGAEPFADRNIPQGISHGHAWIGAKHPKVTIVEYTDYQCPHCKIQHSKMRAFLRKHKDQLRLVHRHYPLDHNCHPKIKRPFHLHACLFARAAFCAGKQNKFWPMNDVLYRDGKSLDHKKLLIVAKTLRLNTKTFKKCLDSDKANDAVSKDLQDGMKAGVRGTPHFIMNGKTFDKGHIPTSDIISALETTKTNTASKKKAKKKPSPQRTKPSHR